MSQVVAKPLVKAPWTGYCPSRDLDHCLRMPPVPHPPAPGALPVTTLGSYTDGPLVGAVSVLGDGTGRLGALSYRVPEGMDVHLGDAVHVPFGRREIHGVVIGPGDEAKATRELLAVYGRRVDPGTLTYATALAAYHGTDLLHVAGRLSPSSARNAAPLEVGPCRLVEGPDLLAGHHQGPRRRFWLRPPLMDPARLAACEAARLAADGVQVLVLAPTVNLVEAIYAEFGSGAVRLDARAAEGSWPAFAAGRAPVGIGTRSTALYSAAHLGALVVVEADHPGHREHTQPVTNARDVAAGRAAACGFAYSATGALPLPSCLVGGVKIVKLGTLREWPAVTVVDRRQFPPEDRLVPPPVERALAAAERDGLEAIVVTSTRQTVRRCARCAHLRPCAECTGAQVTRCTHPAGPCPRCQGTATRLAGYDPPRLRAMFKKRAKVVRLDDLERADTRRLVVLFDVDGLLRAPGLEPEALAARYLLRCAEAAGPRGRLLVLTDDPAQPLVDELCGHRSSFEMARRLWDDARDQRLPPFGRLVTVRCKRERAPTVRTWPGTVYGPRRVGDEWEILVALEEGDLVTLHERLALLRRRGKVRVEVR